MAISTYPQTKAFVGKNARWGAENYLFWAQTNSLDWSSKSDKVKADAMGNRAHTNLAGLQDGVFKVDGLASQSRDQIIYQLRQWQNSPSAQNAWFTNEGLTVLSPATFFPGRVLDSSVTAKIADATDFKAELDAQGTYTDGTILLTPVTLLTGTSGTSSTDLNTVTFNGVATPTATTNGGAAQLHVYALDGGTSPSITVTIQHSPDGASWTTLCTFNAISATSSAYSQRIEIQPTTTINAYVQATWTVSGTPTDAQVLCMVGRYPNAA